MHPPCYGFCHFPLKQDDFMNGGIKTRKTSNSYDVRYFKMYLTRLLCKKLIETTQMTRNNLRQSLTANSCAHMLKSLCTFLINELTGLTSVSKSHTCSKFCCKLFKVGNLEIKPEPVSSPVF